MVQVTNCMPIYGQCIQRAWVARCGYPSNQSRGIYVFFENCVTLFNFEVNCYSVALHALES
jgi:hypothetical protein